MKQQCSVLRYPRLTREIIIFKAISNPPAMVIWVITPPPNHHGAGAIEVKW